MCLCDRCVEADEQARRVAAATPERPDTEDAYLRCVKCGWAYPIETTLSDETCANGNCGGQLVYAIGDWTE